MRLTLRASSRQRSSSAASCSVLGLPCTSRRDDTLARLDLAQHGLAFSANQPCHVSVLATGVERDFVQPSGSSDGRRLTYSCQPSSTQRGIFEPTATSLIRTVYSGSWACCARLCSAPCHRRFEVVELASRHLHHVNDHIARVEQRPLAAVQPFAAERAYTLLLGLFQHVLGQRFDVPAELPLAMIM